MLLRRSVRPQVRELLGLREKLFVNFQFRMYHIFAQMKVVLSQANCINLDSDGFSIRKGRVPLHSKK